MAYTKQFKEEHKKILTIENKEAKKNFQRGFINVWTYNQTKNIYLFKKYISADLKFVGYCVPIATFCLITDEEIPKNLKLDVKHNPKPLWEEQKAFIEKIEKKKKNALVIKANTGFGKTRLMVEFIRKYQTKTLIIVPDKTLLQQTSAALKEYNIEHGLYFGSKKEIKDVTIITRQSFTRLDDDEIFNMKFNMVMIDEVQKNLSQNMISKYLLLNVKRSYGFSATPYTDKISEKDASNLYGEVVEFNKKQIKPCIHTILYKNKYEIDPKEYTTERSKIDKDKERLDCQISEIKKLYNYNKNILVLYDRVSHVETVYKKLKEYKIPTYKLIGDSEMDHREEQTESFKKTGGVIVASEKIAGTGFDVPQIDTVCLFFPNRFDGRIIQMVGRALRKHQGKSTVMVFDWIDTALTFQFYARRKTYKSHYQSSPIPIKEFYETMDLDII